MSENYVSVVDLTSLSLLDVKDLGGSVLGSVLHRILGAQGADDSEACAFFANEGDDGDDPLRGSRDDGQGSGRGQG